MVSHSGTTSRADHLRALNRPKPITVISEYGQPIMLVTPKTEERVMQVQDVWIVQDEWWRQEIDRQYFALLMMNGELRTVFHNRMEDAWYEQGY